MSAYGITAQDLKSFILNNVNNRLGHDVKEKVMPEVEKFGGCEGIASKLRGSTTSGIKASEVEARKSEFGINFIEPDPPTPFWRFCLNALEDDTLRLLLCFALISTVTIIFSRILSILCAHCPRTWAGHLEKPSSKSEGLLLQSPGDAQ